MAINPAQLREVGERIMAAVLIKASNATFSTKKLEWIAEQAVLIAAAYLAAWENYVDENGI